MTTLFSLLHASLSKTIVELAPQQGWVLPDPLPAFTVEAPRDPKHGDIATNIALTLAKSLGNNPRATSKSPLSHNVKAPPCRYSIQSSSLSAPSPPSGVNDIESIRAPDVGTTSCVTEKQRVSRLSTANRLKRPPPVRSQDNGAFSPTLRTDQANPGPKVA